MADTYHKNWIKLANPKPGKAEFALAEEFAKPGSKAAFALAMFAKGCTDNQIRVALGGSQNVLRARLVKAGQLVERRTKENGRTVYRVSLPAKGARTAQSKPDMSGKGRGKPRAAKA